MHAESSRLYAAVLLLLLLLMMMKCQGGSSMHRIDTGAIRRE